jgi:hypothetical protein
MQKRPCNGRTATKTSVEARSRICAVSILGDCPRKFVIHLNVQTLLNHKLPSGSTVMTRRATVGNVVFFPPTPEPRCHCAKSEAATVGRTITVMLHQRSRRFC